MKKFLVLYKASQSGFEQMQKTTPEQQKAGMEAWMSWSKKAASSIVDMGAPLGKSVRVAKGGAVSPVTNDLGGYSVMQAESKEALAATMKQHPHFMMPDGSSESTELRPTPGMSPARGLGYAAREPFGRCRWLRRAHRRDRSVRGLAAYRRRRLEPGLHQSVGCPAANEFGDR